MHHAMVFATVTMSVAKGQIRCKFTHANLGHPTEASMQSSMLLVQDALEALS
jgi:hypothetical protein